MEAVAQTLLVGAVAFCVAGVIGAVTTIGLMAASLIPVGGPPRWLWKLAWASVACTATALVAKLLA